MNKLIIKNSKIHGKGCFANKDFKKGELIIKYKSIKISDKEFEKMSSQEKESVWSEGSVHMKLAYPACYVNHSCDANTYPFEEGDRAIRDIKKGEEITTDYSKDSQGINMECNCGSKNCKGLIKI